jgi:hypothetical protein
VRIAGGDPRYVDTSRYATGEHLITGVDWTPDSRQIVYQVQNRQQTWLDLNLADATGLTTRTVFRETSKAWVNPKDGLSPVWLKDGSFLWLSERTGWSHLYRFKADGTLVRQLTDGPWEVVDWKTGSGRDDPLQLDLYGLACVEIFGKRPEDLTLTYVYLATGEEVSHPMGAPEVVRERIATSLRSIDAGAFDPTPGAQCTYCDFRAFCVEGKAWLAARDDERVATT